MKKSRLYRTGVVLLLSALVMPLVWAADDPPQRVAVQFEGEEYTAEYETLLGRFDGNYVSYYPNGIKRSRGYFQSNHRSGSWTVWDSLGNLISLRTYTDPFTFNRLVPPVPNDPPVQLLGAPLYSLNRNSDNYYSDFYLEERMVMYAKRVWRRLTPENNRHLFHNQRLFHHMLHHAQNGEIALYQDEDGRKRVEETFDTAQYKAIAFDVMEDRVFDRERFVSENRIIFISPVVVDKESLDTLNLFYIYYPHYRKHLAQQPVAGSDLPAGVLHLDDLFFFRAFHGEIFKTDNIYDRTIAEYKQGDAIAREAQRIEIGLIETEHDIWIRFSQ